MELTIEFLNTCWSIMLELSSWLLFGLFISGLLHAFLPHNFVQQKLGKSGLISTIKAVALGIPLPLCSCSVIPTALGLKKDGASKGASMGFLISTPQTGVDSIAVSVSFLGWPFAIFKVLTAFITGIIGGVLIDADKEETQISQNAQFLNFKHKLTLIQKIKKAYIYAIYDLLDMIWFWLLLGVVISAAISIFIPQQSLANLDHSYRFLSYGLTLLISLPLYVCATSSIPIAAALVSSGLPMGAALIFLMAGPATNLATIGAVSKSFGKKATFIYLAVVIFGSFLSAYVFDSLFSFNSHHHMGHHDHGYHYLNVVCAIILAIYMFIFCAKSFSNWLSKPKVTSVDMSIQVEGMTCGGCENKLNEGLKRIEGLKVINVDHKSGNVDLSGIIDLEQIKAKILELGFKQTN
jgi:uncharacterized protein